MSRNEPFSFRKPNRKRSTFDGWIQQIPPPFPTPNFPVPSPENIISPQPERSAGAGHTSLYLALLILHKRTPKTLSEYLKVIAQAMSLLFSTYIVYKLCGIVQKDLEWRATSRRLRIAQDAAQCLVEYEDNSCLTLFVPAMVERCQSWKSCMERGPSSVSRVNILAELVAEVANVFVDHLTWKSSVLILCVAVWLKLNV